MTEMLSFTIRPDRPGITHTDTELRIVSGVQATEPLHLHWSASGACDVHVGASSSITIVEHVATAQDAKLKVQVTLGHGAQVEWISVCTSHHSVHIEHSSHVAKDSSIIWKIFTLGSGECVHNLQSHLTGASALSTVEWAFYAKSSEKYQVSAHNIFAASHGAGQITMNGVAEHKAHVRCNGMVEIGEQGGGTNTYLTQEVLMLDPTARIEAIPGLEIRTNDVKASHSATVRRVSPEDLFYFASRGINESEARRMFVTGFLGKMLNGIKDIGIRETIAGLVEAKYGK